MESPLQTIERLQQQVRDLEAQLAAAQQGAQPVVTVTVSGECKELQIVEFSWEPGWLPLGEHKLYTHPTQQRLDAAVLEALQAALVCMQEDAVAIEAEFGSGRGLAELDAAGELDPAIIKVRKVLVAQAKQGE